MEKRLLHLSFGQFSTIRRHIPEFKMSYKPDGRQKIADSWPDSIDDSSARQQWGWEHRYNLEKLVDEMIVNINQKMQRA